MQNLSIFTSNSSLKNDYPFGMVMPRRLYQGNLTARGSYSFAFNGHEKDGEEWSGSFGNHLDFGARIYDSSLGKWFAVDPLADRYNFDEDLFGDCGYKYLLNGSGDLKNNSLMFVDDQVSVTDGMHSDITQNQAPTNYDYGNIGNLMQDASEQIDQI